MIYICCVGKILLDIKPRKVLLMLNSYKWLQVDWPQRLGSWMCTVINSIYYSNQCGIMDLGGEYNGVDVNATSTRRVQTTPVK